MTVQQAPGSDGWRTLLEPAVHSARRSQLREHPGRVQLVGTAGRDASTLVDVLAGALADTEPGVLFTAAGGHADAVLLVSDAAVALTGIDLAPLRAVPAGVPVLLALTEIDLHPGWRNVLAADLDLLRSHGVRAEPFAVSAPTYVRATAANDEDRVRASGIPALAARLCAVPAQATAATASPRPALRLVPANTRPATGATQDLTPDDEAPAARPELPSRGRRPWAHALADGFAAASSDVDYDLRTRVRAVSAEAERAIDAGDPGADWAAFAQWLRDRLQYEARGTCALLAERVEAVTAAVAGHLDAPPGRAPLPPLTPEPPELAARVVDRGDPADRRRPLATRGRTLLVSAYGGIMMTMVVPRLAGLAVPQWLLIGGAVVTAILLSAATLAGERRRQLDRRRTHAKTLVRHCIDDFLLAAGKFTKDTLRAAQQQLRDEAAALAEELRPPRPARTPAARTATPRTAPTAAPEPRPVPDAVELRREALVLGRIAG